MTNLAVASPESEYELAAKRARARAEADRREFKENPLEVIKRQDLLKIKTKDARFVKFTLKPIQLKMLAIIADLWAKKIPIRIWVSQSPARGSFNPGRVYNLRNNSYQ